MPKKSPPRIDERWIRHDWRMWIRPDIARWMKPGVDPADVIPALARERAQKEAAKERARAAEDAALAGECGDHVRGIDAGLHPARDVGPDPQPPVMANPALVDARDDFLRHGKFSRRPGECRDPSPRCLRPLPVLQRLR